MAGTTTEKSHLRRARWPQAGAPYPVPACDASSAATRDRVDCDDAMYTGCPKSRDRLGAIPAPTDAGPAGHAPIVRRATHRCRDLRDRRSMHWDGDPGRGRSDLFLDAAQRADG